MRGRAEIRRSPCCHLAADCTRSFTAGIPTCRWRGCGTFQIRDRSHRHFDLRVGQAREACADQFRARQRGGLGNASVIWQRAAMPGMQCSSTNLDFPNGTSSTDGSALVRIRAGLCAPRNSTSSQLPRRQDPTAREHGERDRRWACGTRQCKDRTASQAAGRAAEGGEEGATAARAGSSHQAHRGSPNRWTWRDPN